MAKRNELEAAKEEIKANWPQLAADILEPAKVKGQYICPFCNHGANGDGLKSDPKSKGGGGLKCFGCNWHGDIIALYQKAKGASFLEAVRDLAAKLGRTLDIDEPRASERPPRATPPRGQGSPTSHPAAGPAKTEAAEPLADYTDYQDKAAAALTAESHGAAWLMARGLSLDNLTAHKIGYDPASNSIIIPAGPNAYVRRVAADVEKKERYRNQGSPGLFNAAELYSKEAKSLFITEGAFNALAIMEAGGAALALNSAANAEKFLKEFDASQWPLGKGIIIAMDNDKQGNDAAGKLAEGLTAQGITWIKARLLETAAEGQDANDYLLADKEAFTAAVRRDEAAAFASDSVVDYINCRMALDMESFKSNKRTGLANLDEDAAAGFIYTGLYFVSARPSLGKTTLVLQIADNLTAAGHDVIFFSLEMSRFELVSKSLSREMYQLDSYNARTALKIRSGKMHERAWDLFYEARDKYLAERAGRLSIVDYTKARNVAQVRDYVTKYLAKTGRAPVVIIDYCQILQPEPPEPGGRPKPLREAMDDTATTLKRLAGACNSPVIVVSSINRANYAATQDYEALKESGGLEFAADVLWQLQYQCQNDEDIFGGDGKGKQKERRDAISAAMGETPRKIELKCTKNRYGRAGWSAFFKYYSMFDCYEPCPREELHPSCVAIFDKQKEAADRAAAAEGGAW